MCIRHSELRHSSRSGSRRVRANSAALLPMPGDVRTPTPRNAVKASASATVVRNLHAQAPAPAQAQAQAETQTQTQTQAQAQACSGNKDLCDQAGPPVLFETAQGIGDETRCEDPECCQFWTRPCSFCVASARPTASNAADRAPDNPTEPARSDAISATESNTARNAARKLTAKQALRYREAMLAAQSLDAAIWKAIKVAV